ncbi:hypothetical protein DSECCO2_334450 [anaerobic digester metagenome]
MWKQEQGIKMRVTIKNPVNEKREAFGFHGNLRTLKSLLQLRNFAEYTDKFHDC